MWSKKFERCQDCGTTETKHLARGLCVHCYQRDIEARHKEADRQRWIAARTLTKDYLMEEYVLKKKSLSEIAKECNCTRQYVYKMIKHHHVPTRSLSDARQIALKEHKVSFEHQNGDSETVIITHEAQRLNDKFFSTWSSDGEVYYVQINVSKVYDDLLNLGLIPNKSLTMRFPEIRREYVRHFIRGCWDGDGSVFFDRAGRPVAHYVSGSLKFVEGMLEQLKEAGLSERTIHKNKHSSSYYFKFFGPQCKLLYEYFYKDVGPALYLERKHGLFRKSALLYENDPQRASSAPVIMEARYDPT